MLAIGLQTYYHFTPVALSEEAKALDAKAALVPTVTENGYRAYGLLSPPNVEPVTYGRCLVDVQEKLSSEARAMNKPEPNVDDKTAWDAHWKDRSARSGALSVACLQGGTTAKMPKALESPLIRPGVTDAQWRELTDVVVDPLVVSRFEAVWAGEAIRLGARPESPLPSYATFIQIERWRIALAVQAWRAGDRVQASAAWQRTINDWVKSADDTLINAMLSTAAISQALIAIQQSVALSDRIDDATANALIASLQPIETIPDAVTAALLPAWQMMSGVMRELPKTGLNNPWAPASAINEWVGMASFDVNDSLNRLASSHRYSSDSVGKTARGKEPDPIPAELFSFGCTALGDFELACLPFVRNPAGRVLVAIAAPQYSNYGTRIADLRNFAAATRLTIEARRRGVTGDALAQFVASAPADMRDVFSGNAFVYDAAAKRLRIELRAKSTVLGDKGVVDVAL